MGKQKIKNILLSSIFLFFCFLVFLPSARAADPVTTKPPVQFVPQISVGSEYVKGSSYNIDASSIGMYIKAIYKYAIGIVGILAAVVLMFGGLLWLTAGGNTNQVGEAKAWIGASLTGLLIALCSFMIMATINPKLVEVNPIDTPPIAATLITTGNLTPAQIDQGLQENCPAGGQYDPITKKFNCTGSGTHKECKRHDSITNNGTVTAYKCETVNTAGTDTCVDDSSCTQPSSYSCGSEPCGNPSGWSTQTKNCCSKCMSGRCKEGSAFMGMCAIICN
jgi:hypothetical protein